MSIKLGNWVGGQRRPAASGETLDVVNPATSEVGWTIPRSGPADVDAAVAAATAAGEAWAALPARVRADVLDAVASGIEARFDAFCAAESADNGKPVALAARVDIPRAMANFRFFAGAIRHTRTDCHEMADAINYTHRRPLGVSGLITPWNLPLYLLTWKVAPALAMGNTAVCKPSELTPVTASMLGEVFADVTAQFGLPRGIYNTVNGLGAEAGQALVEHPGVPLVSFTGGTQTGKRVAATAAPMFKKLSLELGGKNPSIVFDDADLDATVAGVARAGFANQGEICLCGSRVLVQAGVYEEVVERLVSHAATLKVGDPSHPATQVGSLVSQDHRAKVESYVRLAREEGGTVRCGGVRPLLLAPFDRGAFLQPAVITGLAPSCRTATEEIFGPVVTVHPFDTVEDALSIANGVRYGLAASVWTRDLARAHEVSQRLDCGMVWVNTWLQRDLRVPFGGSKDSGVGREGGENSLEFYSESKNICIKYRA